MRALLLIPLFLFFLIAAPDAGAETTAEKTARILNKIDDMWRGKSSKAVMTMTVQTRHYTRTMKLDALSKGKEKTLVRIMAPLKEKGTATLKSGNEIYTYLPQTDRTIRLNSGMMMGSWMGSHFTNDDLVKESRLMDDYVTTITFDGVRNGISVIDLTLMPKPEAAVVWGKIELTVMDEIIPLKETYYDEDLKVARTMTFRDVREFGGRKMPAVLRVVPADKPDEHTEIVYEAMRFDLDVNDALFSLSSLQRQTGAGKN
ncbi:MAG: outer membrane lipoprotein-sorting protein [Nitrospinae bacterium]|nr:outer membrane lipoprotein-sorting protein [Nitrospinota bacterium]